MAKKSAPAPFSTRSTSEASKSAGALSFDLWIAAALGGLFLWPVSWESSRDLGDPALWPQLLTAGVGMTAAAVWSLRGKAQPCTHSAAAASLLTLLVLLSVVSLPQVWVISEWWGSVARMALYAGSLWTLGRLMAQNSIGIKHLAAFGVGTAFFLAWSVFLDWRDAGFLKAWNDPYLAPGLLGHKNFTASALLIGFWGAVYFWASPLGDRGWRILSTVTVILAAVALALLRTRSIWLGGALGGLAWMGYASDSWSTSFKKLLLPFVGFGLLAGLTLAHPKIQKSVLDPQNLKIRSSFWHHSAEMVREHPWTGVGPGQWGIHFPGYGLNGMDPTVSEGITAEVRPHNDFIWIASEWGLPGLGLALAFVAVVLLYAYRSPRGTEKAYLVAGLLGWLVYSLFEFPLERVAVLLPALGLVAGLGQLSTLPSSPLRLPSWATGVLALLLILPSIYVFEQRRAGTELNAEVLKANQLQQAQRVLDAAKTAFSPWNEIDRYGNPLPYFAGMGALFVEAERNPSNPNFAEAEGYFRTALALHPNHIVTLNQLGNVYRYRNQPKSAIPYYREALKRSRDFGSARLGLAECLLDLDRVDTAGRVLFESFGMSTNGTTQPVRQDPRYRAAVIRWMGASVGREIRFRPLIGVADRVYEAPDVAFLAFEAAKDEALRREAAEGPKEARK